MATTRVVYKYSPAFTKLQGFSPETLILVIIRRYFKQRRPTKKAGFSRLTPKNQWFLWPQSLFVSSKVVFLWCDAKNTANIFASSIMELIQVVIFCLSFSVVRMRQYSLGFVVKSGDYCTEVVKMPLFLQ